MRFANMKIGVRLGLGFGLILLLVAAMGATGIMRLENINDASRNLVDHSLQKQKAAEDWLLATSVNGVRTLAWSRVLILKLSNSFKRQLQPRVSKLLISRMVLKLRWLTLKTVSYTHLRAHET